MGRGTSKAGGGSGKGGASNIDFADGIKQKALILDLADEYNTHLVKVMKGAHHAAGDTDIMGMNMRLSANNEITAIHEFAHTLANTQADKLGLRNDKEFWSEVRKIRTAYRKDVFQNPKFKISSYADADKKLDEFMAEAFVQYKAAQKGINLGEQFGKDLTYANKVGKVIDKYFKKKK